MQMLKLSEFKSDGCSEVIQKIWSHIFHVKVRDITITEPCIHTKPSYNIQFDPDTGFNNEEGIFCKHLVIPFPFIIIPFPDFIFRCKGKVAASDGDRESDMDL